MTAGIFVAFQPVPWKEDHCFQCIGLVSDINLLARLDQIFLKTVPHPAGNHNLAILPCN